MKTLIIQTSPKHTASTFLINAIYGLIPELGDKKIITIKTQNLEEYFDQLIVIKCHKEIDELIEKYKNDYDRIINAELKYPIIMDTKGNIFDGVHRYFKAKILNKKYIKVYKFSDGLLNKFIIDKNKNHNGD